MSALDGWIDVARTGTWTDMHGREVSLDAARFDALVTAYAAGDPAPVVVGHPSTDAPAYGWVDRLRRVGDRLQARLRDIAPAFREAVEAGSYRGRSIALLGDRLRHVGFLGGRPPAIPGLTPTQFADTPDAVVEFGEADLAASFRERIAWRAMAGIARSMRERIIAADGIETADQTIAEGEIDTIARAAEADENEMSGAEPEDTTEEAEMPKDNPTAAELAAERTKPEEDRTKLAAEQAAFKQERDATEAEAAAARRLREADAALAEHVEAGRVLPAERPALAALLASLPEGDDEQISFAAPGGEGEVQDKPRAVLDRLLTALPVRVPYGELAGGPVPGVEAGPSATDQEIGRRARAYRETQLAAGNSITAAQAVDAVTAGLDKGEAA